MQKDKIVLPYIIGIIKR